AREGGCAGGGKNDAGLTPPLRRGTLDARTGAGLRLALDDPAMPYEGGPASMAPDIETLLHLRSLDLFEHLSTELLAELAAEVKEVTFPAGATIVTEGELGDELFVIKTGEVEVTKAGIVLRRAKAGEFFGEVAFLDAGTP